MTDLYPLKIIPEFIERIWGTHDVSFLYPHPVGNKPIGEVWLTGGQCRVANGPLQGRTLEDLSSEYGEALTGATKCAGRFPLLMKVLFPREKLSVQVHPDDELARAAGDPCGKTECWYILKADAGAQIGLGVKAGATRAELEAAIHGVRMEQLLNWVEVSEGEMYYVDAGTVHAIAPGSVIVETQQNSDTTYRLYDYGRPRELHIQQGLAAMKAHTHAGRVAPCGETLVASPCFTVTKKALRSSYTAQPQGNVHCLFALDGAARIEGAEAQPVSMARGDLLVIPACVATYTITPQWEMELLSASVPSEKAAEPATELRGAITESR